MTGAFSEMGQHRLRSAVARARSLQRIVIAGQKNSIGLQR
jgi:hypothetical protein